MVDKRLKGRPLTIMLVEDNPAHAEMVMRSFEEHQVANEVAHVEDGEEALDYLFQRGVYEESKKSPRPEIILLDLRLPKIDGLEVLRQIKRDEGLRQIPVVILTTSKAELDIAQAYRDHANSYLVKPVDFKKFSALMTELGFYWLAWNTRPYD